MHVKCHISYAENVALYNAIAIIPKQAFSTVTCVHVRTSSRQFYVTVRTGKSVFFSKVTKSKQKKTSLINA